jgi:predicted dehydrogenase
MENTLTTEKLVADLNSRVSAMRPGGRERTGGGATTERGALPRLGFLGVGWIGRQRMEAIASSGIAEIAAIADPVSEAAIIAAKPFRDAKVAGTLEDLLALDLDGIVIATPSALHAEQTMTALNRGFAVFCQKPLGRTFEETDAAIQVARRRKRLLAVDLSYRFVEAIKSVREVCASGELGQIYAADLTFHNAYGPDKNWFYDRQLSGGGCLVDLGIHLVDLALWTLGWPEVPQVTSRLFAQGKPFVNDGHTVEDYATVSFDTAAGAVVRIACSWKLPAGCDAIIEGSFYGTRGAAAFRNSDGCFYRFESSRFTGTKKEVLTPLNMEEQWGGRAAIDWARKLATDRGYDAEIEHLSRVAKVLDQAYSNPT